jgi:hypothetical protein
MASKAALGENGIIENINGGGHRWRRQWHHQWRQQWLAKSGWRHENNEGEENIYAAMKAKTINEASKIGNGENVNIGSVAEMKASQAMA